MDRYDVFIRRWWRDAASPGWPDNLEPHPRARKTYLYRGVSRERALRACEEYNSTHKPGRYSLKAEFTRR